MAYQSLELTIDDGLARLTLNQPQLGNPFNEIFCAEWALAANELASRRDVRAVLLNARGKFFSVGGDVKMFSQNLDTLPDKLREWTAGLHVGATRLARLDAPIVAAIHGTCIGGACAIIANCDFVYAARSVRFGAGYTQIGYTCDLGAVFGLSSRMGLARARRFLLGAEMFDADEAGRLGLVDHVVDDEQLFAAAEAEAVRLSRGPTRAYGELRRLFQRAACQPFERQLEDEAQSLARVAQGSDPREGITAFVERRSPNFEGR